MVDRDALISAIRQSLGPTFTPPAVPTGSSPRARRARQTSTSHIYEQYLWTLVIEAANRENARVTYWDVFGNRVTGASAIIFRAGPGHIFSRKKAYTHARFEFPNLTPLEAHVGVKVAGNSEVVHECDVLVLTQEEAETCRRGNVIPRASQVILAIECKLHEVEVPLGEGRGFIGLVTDFSEKTDFYFVSNVSYSVAAISSSPATPSAIRLLAAKRKRWEHNIAPSPPSFTFTKDEDRLINAFQKTFINATAKW